MFHNIFDSKLVFHHCQHIKWINIEIMFMTDLDQVIFSNKFLFI